MKVFKVLLETLPFNRSPIRDYQMGPPRLIWHPRYPIRKLSVWTDVRSQEPSRQPIGKGHLWFDACPISNSWYFIKQLHGIHREQSRYGRFQMENIVRVVVIGLAWVGLSLMAIWLPTWWLWNYLVSPKFGLPPLSFWESAGLLIYIWLVTKGVASFKIDLSAGP